MYANGRGAWRAGQWEGHGWGCGCDREWERGKNEWEGLSPDVDGVTGAAAAVVLGLY